MTDQPQRPGEPQEPYHVPEFDSPAAEETPVYQEPQAYQPQEPQAYQPQESQAYQQYQEPPAYPQYQEPQAYQQYQQPPAYQPQEPQAYQQYQQPPAYQPQAAYGALPVPTQYAQYGIDPVSGLPFSDKSKLIAGLLQIFLGYLGIGRFYMGNIGIAIAQILVSFLTFGIGALWPLIDGIVILVGNPRDSQGRPLRS